MALLHTLAHLHKYSMHGFPCINLQADDACGQAHLHPADAIQALKQPRNLFGLI